MTAKEYKIIYEEILGVSRYYVYYYEDGNCVAKEFLGRSPESFLPIRTDYTKQLDRTNIAEYQQYLCDKLDARTQETISEGFVFDGITFSLSQNAQINISNIPNIPEQAFPFAYLGKEDEYYELSLANKMNFYFTALDAVKSVRIANGALKLQVKELTTTEELDLFKENNNL